MNAKKLVTVGLSVVIALTSTVKAYAPTQVMSASDKVNTVLKSSPFTTRPAKCHNTINPSYVKNNGFGHPVCLPAGNGDMPKIERTQKIEVRQIEKNDSLTVVVVVVTEKNTEVKTEVKKDDKKNCNNGNGNGAEGCNSSTHGNNDETKVKGDKVTEKTNGKKN